MNDAAAIGCIRITKASCRSWARFWTFCAFTETATFYTLKATFPFGMIFTDDLSWNPKSERCSFRSIRVMTRARASPRANRESSWAAGLGSAKKWCRAFLSMRMKQRHLRKKTNDVKREGDMTWDLFLQAPPLELKACQILIRDERSHGLTGPLLWMLLLGVTGLVTTDHKNARDIDINLWAMTNQDTGEYGVSRPILCIFFFLLPFAFLLVTQRLMVKTARISLSDIQHENESRE